MKTKHTIYIIFIVFTLIVLALITLLVYPALEDIKNVSGEILSDKARAISINQETQEVDSFKKNYKEYEPRLKEIESLFVDAKNPVDFIKFLEKTASDASITTNINLVSSQEKSATVASPVVFQVSTKGEFLDTVRFIEKLETGAYLVNIQNLSLKKLAEESSEKEGLSNRVDANFSIEAVTK